MAIIDPLGCIEVGKKEAPFWKFKNGGHQVQPAKDFTHDIN